MKKMSAASLLAIGLALPSVSFAALHASEGPLVYDSTLNITWLKDANLAATQTFGVPGISSDGSMTWDTANAWIAAMNAANYLGHNAWRLPSAGLVSPLGQHCYSPDGSCDIGYNITRPSAEMAHLFHVSLGNTGAVLPNSWIGACDWWPSSTSSCLTNSGPFTRLESGMYWSKEDSGPAVQTTYGPLQMAFLFSFRTGGNGIANTVSGDPNAPTYSAQYAMHAWAVADGHISAVPAPPAALLFGLGLPLVISRRRQRSNSR